MTHKKSDGRKDWVDRPHGWNLWDLELEMEFRKETGQPFRWYYCWTSPDLYPLHWHPESVVCLTGKEILAVAYIHPEVGP